MVDHISQYQRSNAINAASLASSAANKAEALELDATGSKKADKKPVIDGQQGAVRTELSSKARQLNEALNFAKHVPSEESLFNADKVSALKGRVDKGDLSAILAQYNTDDLANSMLKSPTAAFLQ